MHSLTKIDISIVVPLYNEEESITLLYESITQVLIPLRKNYEIIFVDDGSTDRTFDIAKSLHEKDKRLKVVKFRKNYGQTPGMQAGFDHARGEIIISMDGDLQNDPTDIPDFLEKIGEGYDIVCGWRKNRKDKLITRKIPSKIANWLIGSITGVKIHDNGCSLKAYRRSTLKKIRLYSEMHRFIPAMASITGIAYTEIIVNHHARQFGSSKYGISRAWKVFLDLFLMKMLVGFSMRPSLWFGILNIPFLGLSFLFLFLSLGLYIAPPTNNIFPIIYPSVSILFVFLSVNLFLLGLFSELILKKGDFKLKKLVNITTAKIL